MIHFGVVVVYESPCYVNDLPCVKRNQMTCAKMTNLTRRGVEWMG